MTTTVAQAEAIARDVLAQAKQNLVQDGELMPMVFHVCDGHIVSIVGMVYRDAAEKEAAGRAVGELARTIGADGVIAVHDGYAKKLANAAEVDRWEPGNLAEDLEATECIVVAAKGPTLGQMSVLQPYERNPVGDIVFGAATDWGPCEIGLIPNWWTVD